MKLVKMPSNVRRVVREVPCQSSRGAEGLVWRKAGVEVHMAGHPTWRKGTYTNTVGCCM